MPIIKHNICACSCHFEKTENTKNYITENSENTRSEREVSYKGNNFCMLKLNLERQNIIKNGFNS